MALKSGKPAPKSGQYLEVGPKGGKVKEVTISKGEILPPTQKPNSSFKLVDPSKNKSGR
jgi:hypothetical protein